jgi:hypothetical protein
MGGNAPTGFKSERVIINNKKTSVLTSDPDTKYIPKLIFDLYLRGENATAIAKILNGKQIKTAKGKEWSAKKVIRILKNITYCENSPEIYEYLKEKGYPIINPLSDFDGEKGMCLFFKYKGKGLDSTEIAKQVPAVGVHPPLIKSADWIMAQRMLNMTGTNKKGKKLSAKTPFAGLVKCGSCGYSFGLKENKAPNKSYRYFCCRHRELSGTVTCDNSLFIRYEDLVKTVVDKTQKHIQAIIKNPVKIKKQQKENPMATKYKQEIIALRDEQNKLVDNIGKGNMVVDNLLTERISSIDTQIKQLQSVLNETETKNYQPDINIDMEALVMLKNALNKFDDLTLDEQRRILKIIISHITVQKDGNIIIEYRV